MLRQKKKILIVDDEASEAKIFRFYLEALPVDAKVAHSTAEATSLLSSERFHAVLCDLVVEGGGGLEVLRFVQSQGLQIPVIIITAFGSVETAVAAMKAGAYDYVTKPIDYDALVLVVHRAMERQNLIEQVRKLREALDERYGFENIIGRSKGLLRVLEMASRVARRDSTVLIHGETGTGKTLAYLTPAILSGHRVMVSTGTKNLQEQIYFKDIPLLRDALGVPFTATYMKGRGNYLCLHRFENVHDDVEAGSPADRVYLAMVEHTNFLPQHTDVRLHARQVIAGSQAGDEFLP